MTRRRPSAAGACFLSQRHSGKTHQIASLLHPEPSCPTNSLGLLPKAGGSSGTQAGRQQVTGKTDGMKVASMVGGMMLLIGCASPQSDPATHERAPDGPDHTQIAVVPAPGQAVRVGGDTAASVTGEDGDFRAGRVRIDTPLPVGYPPPTPPGAIDLKTYPSVRLAEVSGTEHPDRGMNRTFWPLFNHIKKHDIAMTSPVEVSYRGMETRGQPESWSMAFLYRTPELNEVGEEGVVTVRDAGPMTVVTIGLRGQYTLARAQEGMSQIESWLAENPQWRPAGEWRSLYYNGPMLFSWNKWAEVQLPVEPAEVQ